MYIIYYIFASRYSRESPFSYASRNYRECREFCIMRYFRIETLSENKFSIRLDPIFLQFLENKLEFFKRKWYVNAKTQI